MKEALGSSETSVLQEPHGVTSQKTIFFIVTAVKTSNLTFAVFMACFNIEENVNTYRRANFLAFLTIPE
jgi:hypothetical protein